MPVPAISHFSSKYLLAAAALALPLALATPALGQLEQFGITNGNSATSASQQDRLQSQQEQLNNTEGALGCTSTDPSGCGPQAGGNGLQTNGIRGEQFNFDQPADPNYYERLQPHYRFAPENPTEFQRYVAEVTGLWLTNFGSDLFSSGVSTFAPVQNAPVPSTYVVGPGDEILLEANGQITFNLHLTVNREGEVNIPRVGAVRVAGLQFGQLQDALKQAVGRNFRNFDLNVSMGQLRSVEIFVTGQARRPGTYTVSSLSTLVNALFTTGGPSVNGSLRAIELRRNGSVVTTFDLYDLLLRGDKTKDAALMPEDVIFIPAAGPRAAVFGSIASPGIYELAGSHAGASASTSQDLLTLAGGLSSVAGHRHAELERSGDGSRHVAEISLDPAAPTPLADGDILRVFAMVPRFDNAVTLRGNVATSGRYAWHEGMTLHDLIPDRESLLTRDYWRGRAKLGLPVLDFTPSVVNDPDATTQQKYSQQVVSGNAEEQTTATRAQAAQGQPPELGPDGQPVAQNNNSYARNGTVRVGPSGVNRSTLGSFDQQGGQGATRGATAGFAPPLPQNFPAQNLVELPAAAIDWNYAVIERLDKQTLQTSLLPFDLGHLVMDGDASQNLPLLPGDVVTIFSSADIRVPRQQQTRLVRLDGEVHNAGTYSVKPGETLRQLVLRAGGLTSDAYLFGSSFTRESVRQQQQQRLDEYLNELAIELVQQRAQAEADATLTAGGTAQSGAGGPSSEQAALDSLRQLRATGRMVLQVAPADRDVTAIPDIALEDGDHLVIPATPSNVNVVGSVYNQNAFLYTGGSRAGDYLRQAGGASRLADGAHEFIIRADGSVVSRNREALLSSFDATAIFPGDTLVVPQKLAHPSALRTFLEAAPLFSSIALTAATIAVIQ